MILRVEVEVEVPEGVERFASPEAIIEMVLGGAGPASWKVRWENLTVVKATMH